MHSLAELSGKLSHKQHDFISEKQKMLCNKLRHVSHCVQGKLANEKEQTKKRKVCIQMKGVKCIQRRLVTENNLEDLLEDWKSQLSHCP